jgi:hypothetical protein
LAELNIRKAKQEAIDLEQYGAIDCNGELLKKGEPDAAKSGPAANAKSVVHKKMYLVTPALSEVVEAHINTSPAGRILSSAIIECVLDIMYSVDVWRSMQYMTSENSVDNGNIRMSEVAAAQACAAQMSPEESQDGDTIASNGKGPRLGIEQLEEFIPVLNKISAADRAAVCSAMEAMLMVIETENLFVKLPQKAGSAAANDASTIPPGSNYYTSAENLDLLQEMAGGEHSLSPVALMVIKRIVEIATKLVEEEYSRVAAS